jgi:N-hydroxyarylamine O-acetyltransferase
MNRKAVDLDSYLQRLNCSADVQPTKGGLETIHRAHVYTIPFENFDILLGRGVTLEPAALCDKVLHQPRRGYCFELNGLFLMLLQTIGFDARALLARVHLAEPPSGRTHQLSLVTIQGKQWIADVGFGSFCFRSPIPLEFNHPRIQDGLTFQLTEAEPFGVMLQTLKKGRWLDLYSFDLGHVIPADIELGSHFTSTHPSSFFTFARAASLLTPEGRVSLLNRTLRIVTAEAEQVYELAEGKAYLDALKTHFGIELDASYDALRPLQRSDDEKGSGIEW